MMHTSREDTFITIGLWNLCEVTGVLPSSKLQSVDFARKTNNSENLGYIDYSPMRIVLDVSKGTGGHSSSSTGKLGLLGSKFSL